MANNPRVVPFTSTLNALVCLTDTWAFYQVGAALRRSTKQDPHTKTEVFNFNDDENITTGSINAVWESSSGALIASVLDTTTNLSYLFRNADGSGESFTKVLNLGETVGEVHLPGRGTLGRNSFAQRGNLIVVSEYRTNYDDPDTTVWQSSDDGLTFTPLWRMNITTANRRHVHCVRIDNEGRILIGCGDQGTEPAIIVFDAGFDISSVNDASSATLANTEGVQILYGQQKYRGISPVYNDSDGYWYDYVDGSEYTLGNCGIFRWRNEDLVGTFELAYDTPERLKNAALGAYGMKVGDKMLFMNFATATTEGNPTDRGIYFHIGSGKDTFETVAVYTLTAQEVGDRWLGNTFYDSSTGLLWIAGNATGYSSGYIATRICTVEGIWDPGYGVEEVCATYYVDPITGNDTNNGQRRDQAFLTFERALSGTVPMGSRVMVLGDMSTAGRAVIFSNERPLGNEQPTTYEGAGGLRVVSQRADAPPNYLMSWGVASGSGRFVNLAFDTKKVVPLFPTRRPLEFFKCQLGSDEDVSTFWVRLDGPLDSGIVPTLKMERCFLRPNGSHDTYAIGVNIADGDVELLSCSTIEGSEGIRLILNNQAGAQVTLRNVTSHIPILAQSGAATTSPIIENCIGLSSTAPISVTAGVSTGEDSRNNAFAIATVPPTMAGTNSIVAPDIVNEVDENGRIDSSGSLYDGGVAWWSPDEAPFDLEDKQYLDPPSIGAYQAVRAVEIQYFTPHQVFPGNRYLRS